MWSGFDSEVWRQLEHIREMVALKHQTPTREWPLIHVEQYGELLVIREWPNGSLTAYSTSTCSDADRGKR